MAQLLPQLAAERLLSGEVPSSPDPSVLKSSLSDDALAPKAESSSSMWRGMLSEAKASLKISLPVSSSLMVAFASTLLATGMIGRLGSLELSAVTLARSFYNVVGLSILMGLASGLEPVCGQAFGARHFGLLGVATQRCILVLIIAVIPATIMLCFSEQILVGTGQDKEISKAAAGYLVRAIPSLFFGAGTQSFVKYFATQGQVAFLALGALLQAAATPLFNWVFIFKLGQGLNGAAWAYDLLIAWDLLFFSVFVWLLGRYFQKPGEWTWTGFSSSAFSGWGSFLSVAIPSAAMICLEWWVYEVAIMVAGWQKEGAQVQLASMGLCFQLRALIFMMGQGISVATATRVSNLLGAGRGEQARISMFVNAILSSIMCTAVTIFLLAAPTAWPRLLTTNEEVIATVAGVSPYLAAGIFADGLVAVGSAVLRGTGRPTIGVVCTILTYWLLGLPLGAVLDLHLGLGAKGMWIALSSAAILDAMLLTAILSTFDMQLEVERAQALVLAACPAHDDHRALPVDVETTTNPGKPHRG